MFLCEETNANPAALIMKSNHTMQQIDNDMSIERLSLISFTAPLGNSMSFDEGDDDLHPEARLLMNLSSSTATKESQESSILSHTATHFDKQSDDIQSEAQLLMNFFCNGSNGSQSSKEKHYLSPCTKKPSFFFSCPSLSLEETNMKNKNNGPSIPFVSLSRPLTVYDPDAVHLSAKAMSCNVLHTFQRAIHWRKSCWAKSVVAHLVTEEQEMKRCNKSESEIKSSVLKSPSALVFHALNRTKIEVEDARISFRILPRQWEKDNEEPKSKKQKTAHSSNNAYTKTYVLSMKLVLNFNLPSTSSQVTLEVPGTIDGFFSLYSKELCGVSIDVNTQVLAKMIEKSTRMVVRAAVESELSLAKRHLTTEVPHQGNTTTTLQNVKEASAESRATVSTTSSPVLQSVTVSPLMSEDYCTYRDDLDKLEIPVLGDERNGFLRAVSPELR